MHSIRSVREQLKSYQPASKKEATALAAICGGWYGTAIASAYGVAELLGSPDHLAAKPSLVGVKLASLAISATAGKYMYNRTSLREDLAAFRQPITPDEFEHAGSHMAKELIALEATVEPVPTTAKPAP